MRLSAQIPDALEELAAEIRSDRHGDPHAAFVIFVHSDREPEIVLIDRNSPLVAMDKIPLRKKDEPKRAGRPEYTPLLTSRADIDEAHETLRDFAILMNARTAQGYGDTFTSAADFLKFQWEQRRNNVVRWEMERAAAAAKRPAKCPHCNGSYTVKGLPTHLARAPYCSKQEAKAQAEREAAS